MSDEPNAVSDMLGSAKPTDARPARLNVCARCTKLADSARKNGQQPMPVEPCENWMSNGVRYWAGLCRDCGDFEWSWRWNLRYEAARDEETKSALDRERRKRMAEGRRYYATAGKP